MFERPQHGERAILLYVGIGHSVSEEDREEFYSLAASAGAEIVGHLSATRKAPSPRYLIGSGKLDELTALVEESDADLVLVDLHKSAVIRDDEQETKSRWSPWHGRSLTGWPVRTWVRGQTVFRDGTIDDRVRGREARFDHDRGGYWKTQG